MYDIDDYLMYKKEVCQVKQILKNYMKDEDYYELQSLDEDSLTIKVPVNSSFIKALLTKEEVDNLIHNMVNIEPLDTHNKMIENSYKELLARGTYEDLIKIIKTTYLRNKNRIDNHKKPGDKDNYYFKLAENYLYSEMSIVLNMSKEEVKEYVNREVKKQIESMK